MVWRLGHWTWHLGWIDLKPGQLVRLVDMGLGKGYHMTIWVWLAGAGTNTIAYITVLFLLLLFFFSCCKEDFETWGNHIKTWVICTTSLKKCFYVGEKTPFSCSILFSNIFELQILFVNLSSTSPWFVPGNRSPFSNSSVQWRRWWMGYCLLMCFLFCCLFYWSFCTAQNCSRRAISFPRKISLKCSFGLPGNCSGQANERRSLITCRWCGL